MLVYVLFQRANFCSDMLLKLQLVMEIFS